MWPSVVHADADTLGYTRGMWKDWTGVRTLHSVEIINA